MFCIYFNCTLLKPVCVDLNSTKLLAFAAEHRAAVDRHLQTAASAAKFAAGLSGKHRQTDRHGAIASAAVAD